MVLQVLEARLADEGITDAALDERRLGDLDDPERHAVLDFMLTGHDLPIVLVNGRVASADTIDPDAVVETARGLLGR